jgi:hypothetical protein
MQIYTNYFHSNLLLLPDAGVGFFVLYNSIGRGKIDLRTILIQSICVLGAIGMIVVLYNAVHAWRSDRYQIWGKLQATIFALACLGFLWLIFAGHLLSFNSNY